MTPKPKEKATQKLITMAKTVYSYNQLVEFLEVTDQFDETLMNPDIYPVVVSIELKLKYGGK